MSDHEQRAPFGPCFQCLFFHGDLGPDDVLGACRRHAPALEPATMIGDNAFVRARALWPPVSKHDGCGEFQRR